MPLTTEGLARLYAREIATVKAEVLAYPDDASLWQAVPGLPNSGGNLALHLVGNLRHFIGAGMGGSGYVRDRPVEFSTRGMPRAEVASLVDAAAAEVASAFARVDPALAGVAPMLPLPGQQMLAVPMSLLHLMAHLAYHVGQLDYHRRAVTGDTTSVGAVDYRLLA